MVKILRHRPLYRTGRHRHYRRHYCRGIADEGLSCGIGAGEGDGRTMRWGKEGVDDEIRDGWRMMGMGVSGDQSRGFGFWNQC